MRKGMGYLLAGTAAVMIAGAASMAGPDVIYSDFGGATNYGAVGAVRGYALGSYTCNVGNANMRWGNSWAGTPYCTHNAYRVYNGRIEQIGMAWVKNSCCAGATSSTCGTCNGVGGTMLGVNCRDVYGSGYNGGQTRLSARSSYNAFTGQKIGPDNTSSGDAIFKRLQIPQTDLDAASFPGALYFMEGVYLASDEGTGVEVRNNASYKRVTVTAGTYAMTETGTMQVGTPAIYSWRDHGLGPNVPDPSVTIAVADVAGEGRFYVGSKVTPIAGGQYRYEYVVFNLNSDRSAASLTVPLAADALVVNGSIGFRDVPYHSGEAYAGTDWAGTKNPRSVVWSTGQTFAQNPNANALRWACMYNFWFVSDRAPAVNKAVIGLFKPGSAGSADCVSVMVPAPAGVFCAADVASEGNPDPLAGADGSVTGIDFDVFIESFFVQRRRCDGSLVSDVCDWTGAGPSDGYLTGTDMDKFAELYFKGC